VLLTSLLFIKLKEKIESICKYGERGNIAPGNLSGPAFSTISVQDAGGLDTRIERLYKWKISAERGFIGAAQGMHYVTLTLLSLAKVVIKRDLRHNKKYMVA
jgi:hypothetical protein